MVTKCKCSPAWNATRNLSGVPIARVSRTRRPSSSNWRRCLQALRARWVNEARTTAWAARDARRGALARRDLALWLPVKCARMRPFSTSTRYQTVCHCLGSRHASCASAVTRSAHIFRLAGQRNQTGLIWPIICRDERAVTIARPDPPMTLGNMRELRLHDLSALASTRTGLTMPA